MLRDYSWFYSEIIPDSTWGPFGLLLNQGRPCKSQVLSAVLSLQPAGGPLFWALPRAQASLVGTRTRPTDACVYYQWLTLKWVVINIKCSAGSNMFSHAVTGSEATEPQAL